MRIGVDKSVFECALSYFYELVVHSVVPFWVHSDFMFEGIKSPILSNCANHLFGSFKLVSLIRIYL
jgi:hypothetical protein